MDMSGILVQNISDCLLRPIYLIELEKGKQLGFIVQNLEYSVRAYGIIGICAPMTLIRGWLRKHNPGTSLLLSKCGFIIVMENTSILA